ncbi:MAG: membrane protein insertase YidC [Bacteroidales bacterium]|nr:membrane protein insertase YidC [Bacteroidales bacterium]MDD4670187.1 membrane protein insertase YidC [Bacteroidales bacterium]
MKKNSVIGFALIGIILLLFSWYSTKQFEKEQQQRAHLDSLAAVTAMENALNDTLVPRELLNDTISVNTENEEFPVYRNNLLNEASTASTEYYVLENDKIKVTVSSKGAQPYEVLVKNYYTYDSSALYLVGKDKSDLGLEINTNQWLNTNDLNFKMISSDESSLIMRLYFDEDSFIESIYSLAEGSYMVDYNLRFVSMEGILDRSSTQFKLQWVLDVPRLEKGYDNEKNYSTIAYKYTGSEDVKTLGLRKETSTENFSANVKWFGFQQQFFSAILVADNNFSGGTLVNKFYPEDNHNKDLMQSAAEMLIDLDSGNSDYVVPLKFYFGPNHYPTLKSYDYGFEKIIPLGGTIIGAINRYVIIPCFNWLSKYIASYGLIILILTILLKLVISPLTLKSYMSSAKMKVLKPEIDKINAKYPKQEDAMKKQQATMDLYKRAGVSMFGGCLPMLLQFPILFAMFRFFPASFELRQQSFLWATDLSAYDSILNLGFKIPLYGDHVSLFALLMGISMFFYSKMTMGQMANDQQMPGMKFMQVWFMPIFMVVLCNNFSAGLSYYYMLSNIITIAQNWVIRKWFVDEDKLYAKLKERANSAEPPKKSKFQQRLDAAYKAQQEQMKNQKRK